MKKQGMIKAAELEELLQNPPEEAKGWTRWWWYGCAVTKKEIARELKLMKAAGLGGVEIAVLYPLAADDERKGIHNIPYYSPEFFEIMDFTLTEAEKLEMGVDFTLGSSWPYGGSFVSQDMAPQTVTSWQIDVEGPQEAFDYDFTTLVEGEIVGVSMGRMENSQMIEESVQDISEYLKDKQLYGWPWGKQLCGVQIPEGNWKIVALVSGHYRQTLPIPTRDGQGYAIDHCRRDVTDFFLKNAAQPLIERLGTGRFRCFFCDSIELGGNNWTEVLMEEFRKRRGYELAPWAYGLIGKVGEISPRIRYDYYLTMSELTLENFFGRISQWCREHGVQTRMQAHGTWADILKAYALADIPEGESFGPQDKLHVNTIHRRLASSAAHIYNRKIISNESFTWLRIPRFIVSLENIKAAVDAIFLDGMNAIVNHGYAYSPEELGSPGWPFYASSNLNHTNPAWDCYSEVARYIWRMSAILRLGTARNDVAIYLPQADVWSETPMANLHMGMRLQERLQWGVPDRIAREGYGFDYINDEALTNLGSVGQGITIGGNCYKIILLIGCKRIPVKSAIVLERFVKSGGYLVAAESIPDSGCGMRDWREQDAKIQEIMSRLFKGEIDTWKIFGEGAAVYCSDRGEKMLGLMRQIRRPDAIIEPLTAPVGYLHRSTEQGEIYFLANISEENHRIWASFAQTGKEFRVYDAMSTKPVQVFSVNQEKAGIRLELELDAFGSLIVVFGEGMTAYTQNSLRVAQIQKPSDWTLGVPQKKFWRKLDVPVYWQNFEELRDFCGIGVYAAEFEIHKLHGEQVWLELTTLANVARVMLNGKECGVIWKRPWRLDVTAAIREGKNYLQLRCTGALINSVLASDKEPEYYKETLTEGWPYFAETINQIRKRRISTEKERLAIKEPVNIGLQGPVKILLMKGEE